MDPIWLPYCGAAPLPGDWWLRWNGDPLLLATLVGIAFVAFRNGAGRPFWAGFGILILLFLSPLCALSSALFAVRVAHHVLLTAVVAPLIILGLPRLRIGGQPAAWAAAHILAFWLWHAPASYAFALSSDGAYWLMQAMLLGSALGFWARLRRASAPFIIALLLLLMVQMGLLGALITFAGTPLYAPHFGSTAAWGMSPLEDQQLAGLIMWAPAAALYLGAALWAGWRMLPEPAPA